MTRARAAILGICDGWQQPWDLISGMTWERPDVSEAYDRGVNVGQAVRRTLAIILSLGSIQP